MYHSLQHSWMLAIRTYVLFLLLTGLNEYTAAAETVALLLVEFEPASLESVLSV